MVQNCTARRLAGWCRPLRVGAVQVPSSAGWCRPSAVQVPSKCRPLRVGAVQVPSKCRPSDVVDRKSWSMSIFGVESWEFPIYNIFLCPSRSRFPALRAGKRYLKFYLKKWTAANFFCQRRHLDGTWTSLGRHQPAEDVTWTALGRHLDGTNPQRTALGRHQPAEDGTNPQRTAPTRQPTGRTVLNHLGLFARLKNGKNPPGEDQKTGKNFQNPTGTTVLNDFHSLSSWWDRRRQEKL